MGLGGRELHQRGPVLPGGNALPVLDLQRGVLVLLWQPLHVQLDR